MRNVLITALALAAASLAAPASAADVSYIPGPVAPIHGQAAAIPLQAAVDIANQIGLVSVSNTNRWGDEWQIEGYDIAGGYIEVDVDARTGAVVNVDR